MGIFVYCTADEKLRIQQARKRARQTLSNYMLEAALRRAEHDEAHRRPKK